MTKAQLIEALKTRGAYYKDSWTKKQLEQAIYEWDKMKSYDKSFKKIVC